jgi:hypothetical protein
LPQRGRLLGILRFCRPWFRAWFVTGKGTALLSG